jgi:hypothetical protein
MFLKIVLNVSICHDFWQFHEMTKVLGAISHLTFQLSLSHPAHHASTATILAVRSQQSRFTLHAQLTWPNALITGLVSQPHGSLTRLHLAGSCS